METDNTSNENVYSLIYVRMWKILSSTVGLWPKRRPEDKQLVISIIRKMMFLVMAHIVIGIISYMYKHNATLDFSTRAHICLTLVTGIVTGLRTLMPSFKRYHEVAGKLLNEFHLIHFTHKSEYSIEIRKKLDVYSYYLSICMLGATGVATILFNLPTLYYNLKIGAFSNNRLENSTRELSVYYSVPGLNAEKMFFPVTIYNFYLAYIVSACHCALDNFLSLTVFQIIGHVNILKYNIENIAKPKNKTVFVINDAELSVEKFDEEENKQIHKDIMECARHHQFIISFTGEVTKLFGPVTAISYLLHLFCCCISLLQLSTLEVDAFVRYGFFTIAVFGQLCYISILFEVLGATSETLIDTVYFTPWECMNVPNRRTVLMILRRMQIPIRITALGLAEVGLNTMVAILKVSFSYYTFFRSFRD